MSTGIPILAGALTIANPCVLPMLPMLFSGAFAEGKGGPAWLAAGLVGSFTLVGTTVAMAGRAAGLDPGTIRYGAAVLLFASGLILVSRRAQAAFSRAASPLAGGADGLARGLSLEGNRGQFLLGVVLGAVWTPCVGPTLGAAVAAAAAGATAASTAGAMALFAFGMATVFLALAYMTRGLAGRRGLLRTGALARKGFGWLLVLSGGLVLSGLDKVVEAEAARWMPEWLLSITTRF